MKVSSVCFDEGSFVDLGTPVQLKNMFAAS